MPPRPPILPPEIWRDILSYLPESEVIRIHTVNQIFYDVAMDHLYKLCLFPFYRDSPGSELLRAGDNWRAKRIKRVEISTLSLFETRTSPASHTSLKRKTPWSLLRSVLLRCIAGVQFHSTNATLEDAPCDGTSKGTADRVLDALSGAENLQKATIRLAWCGNFDLELDFARSLSSVLFTRTSISELELILRPHKLHSVLPLMEFRGLKDVCLHLYDTMPNEVSLSLDTLCQFLKYLAPSLEVLNIMTNRYDVASRISDALFDKGTVMPKLRELAFYTSIHNPGMFEVISFNYPALMKLKMWPIMITASPPPLLESLQLPELRILELWFPEPKMIPGFWDRSSRLPQLDTFHLLAGHLCKNEVSRICRFWSQTRITRLLIKVEILDGHLIDLLAASFPALRDLTLYARWVIRPGLEEEDHASFRVEMKERRYSEWGLARLSLSLYQGGYSIAMINILAVAMPNVEFNNLGYHR